MTRRAFKSDEDHEYYGHSWWRVNPVKVGCIILVIALLAVGVPIAYRQWIAPTRALTVLNNKESPKREKLAALRTIREAEYVPAFFAVESRLKDENEHLAVRGAAARTLAVLGSRAQIILREVFESTAPAALKMEILHHLDAGAREIIEIEAATPTDRELGAACREWLEIHPE